jgi:CRP/FNR family transcriptional regulator, cyclic AMP receptor protein
MPLRTNAKIELIRKIPLFKHCSKKQLAEIAALADEVDLKEGTELTHEGRVGREFFVIVQGNADVWMGGQLVNTVRQGDFLGEVALVTGRPRTATVKATTPVRVLVITARDFSKLMDQAPEIQRKVLVALAERLATATL